MNDAREMLAIKQTPPTFTISRLTFARRWIAVEIVISGALLATSIWYLSNADWYSTILFASTNAAVNVASMLARKMSMFMIKPNVKQTELFKFMQESVLYMLSCYIATH